MEFIKVADGFAFPEGPTYDKKNGLFVVNCNNNRLDRLVLSADGKSARKELYAELPGKGNGTTLHKDGTLYVADFERKAILRIPAPNKVEVVVDSFEGKPFLGPNDLCFDKHGNLYFTDPRDSWNKPVGAAYRLKKNGTLERFGTELMFPNGIALDLQEKYVYVAETPKNRILRWAIQGDTLAKEPEEFAKLPAFGVGPDGMRFDSAGHLYIAHFGGGVLVIDRQGKEIQRMELPGKNVTNLEFGGKDGKLLYVTETQTNAVYVTRLEPGRKL